jgi:DNA-binding transcriptional LysR family regulator
MTLQQLRYFISVAQNLSFSRAAQIHYVSQTAVSQQIKLLEEELGVSLLVRTHRTVGPTAAGRLFYDYAVQIVSLAEQAQTKVRELAQLQTKTLRIAVGRGLETVAFMEQLLTFKERHPELELAFYAQSYQQGLSELQQGNIDLSLMIELYPLHADWLGRQQLSVWQNYVVMNRRNPLSRQRSLTAEQLAGEQLYILTQNERFVKRLSSVGLNTRNGQHVESLDAAQMKITFQGGYITLAEPVLAQIESNHNLVAVPLENDPVPVCLYWNKEVQNPTRDELLTLVQKER